MILIRNYLYLAGAETASKLLTFAAMAYLARVAGPAGYGYIEFAAAVLFVASLMVDQGFGPYGAREIAKNPTQTPALVAEIVAARFVFAVAAFAVVMVVAFGLKRPAAVTQLLVIYSLGLIVMPLLLQWVFQGHDRMHTVAAMQLLRQAVFALVVFVVVRTEGQIWGAAAAETLAACAAAAFGLWFYMRSTDGRAGLRLALTKRPFVEGLPIGLGQIFWTVRVYGATLILGFIALPDDVGLFAGSMRILVGLHAFVWLYYFNLLPSLARAWRNGHGSFGDLVAQSLRGIAWVAALGALLWIGMAPLGVSLIYGPAFAAAGTTLQWLGGVCMIALISGHYRFGLIAAGRQTLEMITSAIGAVIAIVLIPVGYHWMGPAGSAAGLLVAELVVWVSAWAFGHRILGLKGHLRILLPPAIALAVALGVLRYLPTASRILPLIVATVFLVSFAFIIDGFVRQRVRQVVRMSVHLVRRQVPKPVPWIADSGSANEPQSSQEL